MLIALAVSPALPASSSCVSPAASRSRLSRTPNGASSPDALLTDPPFDTPQHTSGVPAALVMGEGQVGSAALEHFECYSSVTAVWMVCRCVERQILCKSKQS